MRDYLVPTAYGQVELVEKRSRFIGQIWQVDSEEAARARIAETKAKYHDARHNCWCYIIREGGILRYSDDGEPQGTAGQPMLEVFRREGIENLCCVVTRYFGGILLGTGGLLRAYTLAAKEALADAGVSVVSRWVEVGLTCPYALLERLKLEAENIGGVVSDISYEAEVTLFLLFLEAQVKPFCQKVTELTAGKLRPEVLGQRFQAVPRTK